ncbi:uncharacterized protein LOC108163494 [Drosophila miranda]|uniref:uncharacterized protein LOC108163494 n=1 Tax=Drosophila miranda TaxID=7229 RepID=UPI0007E7979A|nr:uncharacterized protein LOC108163494 [Drosophila miranda]
MSILLPTFHSASNKIDVNDQRQSKSKKRQGRMGNQHIQNTQSYSSFNQPISEASTSEDRFLRLNRYEYKSTTSQSSIRKLSLFETVRNNSNWSRPRLIHCPCHACHCSLDPSGLLGHYLRDHLHGMGVPFAEVRPEQKVSLCCHISSLEHDVNTLLGVFGYRRSGLNPLKCARNNHLPAEYRQYSQHGVLMVFGCRTQHSLLWHRKPAMDDVLAVWVSTPLQDVSVCIRLLVQAEQSSRSYSKHLKARSVCATQDCKEFIKTDSNSILISFADLRGLMDLDVWQQLITVDLKILGEQIK